MRNCWCKLDAVFRQPEISCKDNRMNHATRTPAACLAVAAALLTTPALAQEAAFPSKAELQYVGPYGVPATMVFQRQGNQYRVDARISAPLYQMHFASAGIVNGNALQPTVYTDTRKNKRYAEARFGGGQVRYGKAGEPPQVAAVKGPTMDLFTLGWQLAMNGGTLPKGLSITNGKKLYPVSGMSRVGSGTYRLGGGAIPINRYRVQRGDDTVEYAFAPDFHNIPAQIIYRDDGKSYTLKLKSIKINGKPVQPK